MWSAIALVATIASSPTLAGDRRAEFGSFGNVSIETIFEFGNDLAPIVIDQSSAINIATIVEIGLSGPVDATVVQTGMRNTVDLIQVGNSTNAVVAQMGQTNAASITQAGKLNNSMLLQIGMINSGTVQQFSGGSMPGRRGDMR